MKLKTTEASNHFCVPAALALLTNKTVDEAEALLRQDIGDQPIRGVFYPLILKNLQILGFTWIEHQKHLDTTSEISGIFMKSALTPNPFLLVFHGHVGVIQDGVYFDNQHPNGTSLSNCGYRKAENAFEVFKK